MNRGWDLVAEFLDIRSRTELITSMVLVPGLSLIPRIMERCVSSGRIEPRCGFIVLNAVDHAASSSRRTATLCDSHDQRPVLRRSHQLPGGFSESALRPMMVPVANYVPFFNADSTS